MKHIKLKSIGIIIAFLLIISLCLIGVNNTSKIAFAESEEKLGTYLESELQTDKAQGSDDCVYNAINEITTTLNEAYIPGEISLTINSSSQDIINAILSDEPFTIKGSVTSNLGDVDINNFYDFSKFSKFDIAEWAYVENLITEEEKIEIFCDLIINRNFSNIDCLYGVFNEINDYYEYVDSEVAEKIKAVLAAPFDDNTGISTLKISSESTYSSDNFTIHYDHTKTTFSTAKDVADYFEVVRTEYINLGFKTPKLQWFKSTYQVYLDPDSDPDGSAAAVTIPSASLTNTCASYIIIYDFSSLSTDTKERIAHEYFHAIQNAYNRSYNNDTKWFSEACANWGKLIISGSLNTASIWINDFINSVSFSPLPNTTNPQYRQYGAVLFVLTIHSKYGGASVIRSIYEAFSDEKVDCSLTDLCTVITKGIVNNGYPSGSFNMAYRAMSAYLIDPSIWYKTLGYTTKWKQVNTNTWETSTAITKTYTGDLDYLTSQYYEIKIPNTYSGRVKVNVTFSSDSGTLQVYTIDKNNSHFISYYVTTSSGTCYAEKSGVGSEISKIFLVLSNVSRSDTVSFTVQLSLYNDNNKISFTGANRYEERLNYIPKGGYEDYTVTFATAGSKTIQTFGDEDTILELYSASGTLLARNDDSGYSYNALIRYYTSANTTYVVRVKFYSSSNYGETLLAITPAYGALESDASVLSKYEEIYSITTTNYTWSSFAEQNYTRMVRFIPSSSTTYTFELSSSFDNFIYVIDPRYAMIHMSNVDYNDDGGTGLNAKLSKYLEANIPYLVIYSAYNPSDANATGDLVLTISK